eukprot:6186843-Pleurochrysis_carterae.AAC.1
MRHDEVFLNRFPNRIPLCRQSPPKDPFQLAPSVPFRGHRFSRVVLSIDLETAIIRPNPALALTLNSHRRGEGGTKVG